MFSMPSPSSLLKLPIGNKDGAVWVPALQESILTLSGMTAMWHSWVLEHTILIAYFISFIYFAIFSIPFLRWHLVSARSTTA